MKQTVSPDIVSYNILLKVYCTTSDPAGAKDLLLYMDKAGIAPNDVSYNCIINAAMSSGNFEEVWNAVDLMEKNGFTPDQYTVSILMRGLKKVKDVKDSTDVIRALKLLDRSSVDVCSDETLLNNVLETCTRHRQVNCLGKTVASFLDSNLKPSLHTYCSLIKAASKAQSCGNAQKLWNAMVYERGMQPNDVTLGCMLDALVNNVKVEEAVSLLNKWKASIPPTTEMYCTLIRGFANDKQPQRALDMWKEMNSRKLPLNTVVFNALIDAQAQVGAMDEVAKLVQSMEPNGISPDVLTFSSIAKGYCCKGDVQKAFDVFRSMQRRGMAIDSIVYNTIMDAAMRHNRIDLVDMALEDMEKNNVVPSNFTLGILVKVYGQQHRLDKAFKIIEELPQKHGIKVNTQVRTCLMCACLNNHDIDRAMKVFEDIKGASAGVDAKTYSSLIAGLVRIGAPEKGIAFVDQAYGLVGKRGLTAGQNLDSECLEQLVQALGKSKETKAMGCKLVDRMRSAGVPISGKLVVLSGRM
jgi:pentatricopeptide repeat protein